MTTTQSYAKGSNLTAAEATTLRQHVRDAMAAQTKTTLRTAALLFDVYYGTVRQGNADVPLAVAWGHDDFDEFAEHELGMHQTTARGLVHMHEELFCKRDLKEGSYPHSITKLRQLTRVSKRCKDGRTFGSWVAKATEMSCCEFEEAVENEFGEGAGRYKRLGFSLKLASYTSLLRKLRGARESFGVESNGEALTKIVDEWSELHQTTDRVRTKPAKKRSA
jgi:hypothetical protein